MRKLPLRAERWLISAFVMTAVGTIAAGKISAADVFPGNPPITPYWALGHWVWEDIKNTQASTVQLVKDYQSHAIPVGGVIVDSPWETKFNTFVPATGQYPDFAQMIADFHKQGVGVIAWMTAYINPDSPDYATVKTSGYVVNPAAGNIAWWKGAGVYIDHTNPAAQAWLDGKMDNVLAMGLDGWKLDMGPDYLSGVGKTVTLSAGSTAGKTLPLADFQKYYYQTIYDHITSKNPAGVITGRGYAGTPGGTENKSPISKNPLCWQGDFTGDFAGIATQAGMVYQTAINGYGCPGVEIGGYTGAVPSKNSLLRYAQFAALSCFMENGGANGGLTGHLPWTFDQQATDVYRYFATLHSELAPYTFSGVVDSHLAGGSVMKSADKTALTHKLGRDLFVAILTKDVTVRDVAFPAGDAWIDYSNDGTAAGIFAGGSTKTGYAAALDAYPIFVRAGAIIPMDVKTEVTGHGDATSAGKSTVLVYPYGQSSMTFHRPTGTGVAYEDVSIAVNETAGTITVKGPSAVDYRFKVKALAAPSAVTGATSDNYDAAKNVLTIDKTAGTSFVITIGGLVGYAKLAGPAPVTPGAGGSEGNGGATGTGAGGAGTGGAFAGGAGGGAGSSAGTGAVSGGNEGGAAGMAGGAGGSSSSVGGAAGAGGTPDVGGSSGGASAANGSDGCGCRLTGRSHSAPHGLLLVAIVMAVYASRAFSRKCRRDVPS
jgi:hypothetical protein